MALQIFSIIETSRSELNRTSFIHFLPVIAGSLLKNRTKILLVMDVLKNPEVSRIIVSYADKLMRRHE